MEIVGAVNCQHGGLVFSSCVHSKDNIKQDSMVFCFSVTHMLLPAIYAPYRIE